MKRLGALALLLALFGACVATPIPLPGNEDLWISGARDAGASDSATAADIPLPNGKKDLDWQHGDGTASLTDATGDAASDGLCLECPLPDAMTDAGAADAEGGPGADALTDLHSGELMTSDLAVGE